MSKTCYVDVQPEQIQELAENIKREHDDSILVLPVIAVTETLAPTKKNKNHRIKFEAIIPPEAIQGTECVSDLGCMAVLRIPRSKVNPELIQHKEENK